MRVCRTAAKRAAMRTVLMLPSGPSHAEGAQSAMSACEGCRTCKAMTHSGGVARCGASACASSLVMFFGSSTTASNLHHENGELRFSFRTTRALHSSDIRAAAHGKCACDGGEAAPGTCAPNSACTSARMYGACVRARVSVCTIEKDWNPFSGAAVGPSWLTAR